MTETVLPEVVLIIGSVLEALSRSTQLNNFYLELGNVELVAANQHLELSLLIAMSLSKYSSKDIMLTLPLMSILSLPGTQIANFFASICCYKCENSYLENADSGNDLLIPNFLRG